MYNNYAFQQNDGLTSNASGASAPQLESQQILAQPVPGESVSAPLSPTTVMIGCLTPFCIAFLAFSVYLMHRRMRLNRGLKRLQCITTLERALEKTPDECS